MSPGEDPTTKPGGAVVTGQKNLAKRKFAMPVWYALDRLALPLYTNSGDDLANPWQIDFSVTRRDNATSAKFCFFSTLRIVLGSNN